MKTYYEELRLIRKFLKESNISPYDLRRISKDLCCCGKCRFYVEHYLKDGRLTDFGHCCKNKIPKGCKAGDVSCGYWDDGEEQVDD